MNVQQFPRKLITFSEKEEELSKVQKEINNGWTIVSLVNQGEEYFGIMEKIHYPENMYDKIYIPARKKVKIVKV